MDEQTTDIRFARPGEQDFLVVGIGASAGGVEALQEFFRHVPASSNIAYVVILHLSPDYDSQLAAILGRETTLPVTEVTERVQIEPDHIYVVSPNQHLTMEMDEIAVTSNLFIEDRRAPVDIFFRTLGDTFLSRSVGVILSGTGANGSMGIKRIKECGGAAFVQNPREAHFNEMPRNAIATDLIDNILPVAEIPARIVAYKESLGMVQIVADSKERPEDQQQALREIFTQLRVSTGHDFTNYKRPTLLRRIERRINVHSLQSLTNYAAFMQEHPEEATALLKDLLISVTNFFRDKKAFNAIENDILPLIFQHKTANTPIRIWVIGCATGEEAYSLAMLFAERTMNMPEVPKVQIFATDIDETAIAAAREGIYTLNDAADVSPERLRRFFSKEGDSYRIRREIREMILFASHNILKDPPFSHLDMVSCRNMLIYLNHTAQERVMETVHFALEPGGYLFLGSAESVDGAGDLFLHINREHHIYQSRAIATRTFPVPERIPNFQRAGKTEPETTQERESRQLSRLNYADLHQQLLEQYAPPSLVVNEEYDIVHITEHAGKYLQIGGGELSKNVLKLIRPELRLELRTALFQAVERRANVEAKDLTISIGDTTEAINIQVRPVLRESDTAKGFMLVLFEKNKDDTTEEPKIYTSDEPIARHLEEELVRMKTQLRNTVEQHEMQAEELKASNEELQAMNEELRSAAEELETSKEELQSINEELTTVNQELKVKVEETSISNSNFQNLISSTDIATLFLDRSLRISMFTPAARDIFNVIPADFGRPISDITNKLNYPELLSDAETVLERLKTTEREVYASDGNIYLMRGTPYRTEEDRINGMVMTFINITARKRAEEQLRASEEQVRLLIESAKDYAIFSLDTQRQVISWSTGAEAIFGYTEKEIINKSGDIIFTHEDRRKGDPQKEFEKAEKEGRAENERWHLRKDDSRFWGSGISSPVHNEKGELLGFVKIMRDLTESKKAEEALRVSEERYRIAMEAAELATWDWNLVTNKVQWNKEHFLMFGLEPVQTSIEPEYFLHFIYPEDLQFVKNQLMEVTGKSGIYQAEFRITRENDKQIRWMNGHGRVTEYDNGKPTRVTGIMYDSTKRRQAAEELLNAQNSLTTALEAAQMGVWDINFATGYVTRSARHDQLLGYQYWQEDWSQDKAKHYIVEEDKALFDAAYVNMLTNGVFELEARIQNQNDAVRWVHYYGRVFKNEKGEPLHAAGVIFDITDRKMAEQKKDDFIGIASHELKTPVTSIKAYTEILRDELEATGNTRILSYTDRLSGQVDRLTKLIKDLLDATRVSEGRMTINVSAIDINQLISGMIEDLQKTTDQHIIVANLDHLPNYKGDQEKLQQVFANLFSNAIKYSPNADKILIKTCHDNTNIYVEVHDYGIGISRETQDKLFERFFRSYDPNIATFPGLGLGLYISLEIVKLHKGDIKVKSEKGKGSVFTVVLPLPA